MKHSQECFLSSMSIWTKLAITLTLSAISVALFLHYRNISRKRCMWAMLLSTIGDLFMTNIIGIPKDLELMSTVIGAAFFGVAHILYATCFDGMRKEKDIPIKGVGLLVGLVAVVGIWVALLVVMLTKSSFKPVMFPLISLYLVAIGVNVVNVCIYSFGAKRWNLLNAFGVIVFLASDILIFLEMLAEIPTREYVWYVYPFGQLFLLLFNTPLSKRGTEYTASYCKCDMKS